MKECSTCKSPKPAAAFSRQSDTKDGLRSRCKDCDRAYRLRNPGRSAQYMREWKKRNPGYDLRWRRSNPDHNREWKATNAERYREQRKEYYLANREREIERTKNWVQANRARYNAYKYRYRAVNRPDLSGGRAPGESLRYAEMIMNDPCVYCGAAATSLDHIRPVSRGGGAEWLNLAPACLSCNSSKCDKELLQFLMHRQTRSRYDGSVAA